MDVRVRVLVLALVVSVTIAAAGWAQVLQRLPVEPPIVLSGSDVGFQINAREGDTPVGTIVVRINGQWVPVRIAPITTRLSQ
jgi:hypothetical protein